MPRFDPKLPKKPRPEPKSYAHITQKLLLETFTYDPDTGTLTRRARNGKAAKVEARTNKEGYIVVSVGASCLAHRVIWFMQTGSWPSETIDHDNGVKNDNRWANLKPRSWTANMLSHRNRSPGEAGVRGARKQGDKFRGVVCFKGKDYYTPTRDTLAETEADLIALRLKLRDQA